MKDRYLIQQMTLEEIGEKFSISKRAVLERLRRARLDVKARAPAEANAPNKKSSDFSNALSEAPGPGPIVRFTD